MAAPNLLNLTSAIGKSKGAALTTSTTALLTNVAGSGKLLKVTSVYVSNVDGTNDVDVSLMHNIDGTNFHIAKSKTVAAKDSLILVTRNAPLYIEEDDELNISASAASDAEVVVIYEELS